MTWKESNDHDRDTKLDRIEFVSEHHPDRTFAFDEFRPLNIRPAGRVVLCARRTPPTTRTRPSLSREGPPMGTTSITGRVTDPRERFWSGH